jgi:hypothetical protein
MLEPAQETLELAQGPVRTEFRIESGSLESEGATLFREGLRQLRDRDSRGRELGCELNLLLGVQQGRGAKLLKVASSGG